MFSAEYESREKMTAELRRLNAVLVPRGLRILPMRYMQSRVLLYLYRPDALRRDLENSDARDILRDCGYEACCRAESCLSCLIGKMRSGADFPHEVGLFLGYPPEDVRGFMEKRRRGLQAHRLLEGLRRRGRGKRKIQKLRELHSPQPRQGSLMRSYSERDEF